MSTGSVDCAPRRTKQYHTSLAAANSWQAPSIQSAITGYVNFFTDAYYKITTYLLTQVGGNTSQN
eukprot:9790702-Ditylum_brightwellii.AAC.1